MAASNTKINGDIPAASLATSDTNPLNGSPTTGGNNTIINAGVPPASFCVGDKGIYVDFPLVSLGAGDRQINGL
ncbi:hypothetical protein NG798_24955 [Ancylothrix sp. C2]|uniref:hypothetical protein n=1 Tax=Ancylothrix sp. D3o TaxID=2953691 RepID=UPI0021BB0EF9|nr:hypothetical protein [Ancylothrix sp. D3o]MCT7953051.1 hypothetical protein [Ancylothrix sp. D3o]